MAADLPPLQYGYVKARFVAGIGESAGSPTVPDAIPLTGTVTFNLSADVVRVTTAQPVPTTIYPQPITAVVDTDGYLTWGGARLLPLLATNDPAMNPTNLQWTVSFDLSTPNGYKVPSPPWRFALPVGETIDLTAVAPLSTPALNTVIVKGDKGDKGDPGPTGGVSAELVASIAAEQMANPESALQGQTVEVIEGVLGGGVAGMIRVLDARTNLALARGTWAGMVLWLVNTGSANPANFLPGDVILEVDVVAVAWTPAQLAGKLLWLDAQSLTGLSGGAPVASWPDLTGSTSQAAVQATSSKQPTYTLNKINGHPAVVADGVDDALIATLTADYPSALTIYAVGGTDLADNTSGADYLWDASDTTPNYDRASLYRGTDESFNARRGTTVTSAAAAWTTGAKIIRVTVNGASSSIRVGDSKTVASGSLSTSAIVRAFHLFTKGVPGSTNYFAGYLGEFLVVGGVPSTDDDAKIMTYLKSRWGF